MAAYVLCVVECVCFLLLRLVDVSCHFLRLGECVHFGTLAEEALRWMYYCKCALSFSSCTSSFHFGLLLFVFCFSNTKKLAKGYMVCA